MVLKSETLENNNNLKQIFDNTESQERELLTKIQKLLPVGYNLPENISEYELILMTIQYIEALQSLTRFR